MANSPEITSRVLSCPDVADGNPASMHAIANLAHEAGIRVPEISLHLSSRLVHAFHGGISSDPSKAAHYTKNSEARRLGLGAQLYARLAAHDFAHQLEELGIDEPIQWIAVQEHQLLGMSTRRLRKLGVSDIELVVPDVYPKESAVEAVIKHDNSRLVVWNHDAYSELIDQGLPARLVKPFLVDGFRSTAFDLEHGDDLIVKSSGSGMPADWARQLTIRLTQDALGLDWSMHIPGWRFEHQHSAQVVGRRQRLGGFFGRIGLNTRVIVGYPTELIGVVAGARLRGAETAMLALPPRGRHEVRNMEFASDNGLLIGEVRFDASQKQSLDSVELIDLCDVVDAAKSYNTVPFSTDVVGDKTFWDSAT